MGSCSFNLLIPLLFVSSIAILVSGHQFEVGGDRGWAPPTGNEAETYNEWAEQHRFHIGDSIHFNYQDDSVLVVSKEGYNSCNGSSPVERFGAGGATFEFNRHGFFYFISGDEDNCEAGQRIIIRVMVQNVYHRSSLAPAPSPGGSAAGGQGGSHAHSGSGPYSSASMVSVTSYLLPTISFVLFILQHLIMKY